MKVAMRVLLQIIMIDMGESRETLAPSSLFQGD